MDDLPKSQKLIDEKLSKPINIPKQQNNKIASEHNIRLNSDRKDSQRSEIL